MCFDANDYKVSINITLSCYRNPNAKFLLSFNSEHLIIFSFTYSNPLYGICILDKLHLFFGLKCIRNQGVTMYENI